MAKAAPDIRYMSVMSLNGVASVARGAKQRRGVSRESVSINDIDHRIVNKIIETAARNQHQQMA